MSKKAKREGGYRRAAAGVMGCLLVGSTLGSGLQTEAASQSAFALALQPLQDPSDLPTFAAAANVAKYDNAYVQLDRRILRGLQRKPIRNDEVRSYEIQAGDTFWHIAAQYGTTAGTLISLNPNLDPTNLQPGQVIQVVNDFSGLVYDVQPGDFMEKISASYGLAVEDVEQANQLGRDDLLQIGQKLLLPGVRPRIPSNMIASRGTTSRSTAAVAVTSPEPVLAPALVPLPAASRAKADASWIWPIVGGLHTSEFGGRWGGFHSGLDIAVAADTPAFAAKAGTVTFAGWDHGYGYSVMIDHGDGFESRYSHASTISVTYGQQVSQGDLVVKVGSTGNSTGPHLHFEIIVNGTAVNPRIYLP